MSEISSYRNGQFCWVDLVTVDLKAATSFYEQLFGWQAYPMDTEGGPQYQQFRLGEAVVAGAGQMSEEMIDQGLFSTWNSYINVSDIGATVDLLLEHGASITVPAQEILEYGRLAFFQDPTGGNVGVWEPGTHIGSTLVNQPGCFCWNELATRDAETAARFYGQVFGWSFRPNPQSPTPYQLVDCEEQANGGILQMDEKWGDTPPSWTVYFNVESLEEVVERIPELGGKVCHGPFDTSVGKLAVIQDPHGAAFNLIGLTQAMA